MIIMSVRRSESSWWWHVRVSGWVSKPQQWRHLIHTPSMHCTYVCMRKNIFVSIQEKKIQYFLLTKWKKLICLKIVCRRKNAFPLRFYSVFLLSECFIIMLFVRSHEPEFKVLSFIFSSSLWNPRNRLWTGTQTNWARKEGKDYFYFFSIHDRYLLTGCSRR